MNENTVLRALCIVLALIAGFALPFQAAANATLGKHTPTLFHAALVNFLVGGAVLAAISLAAPSNRPLWSWDMLWQTPWWGWTAGLVGASYISMTVKCAPVLGAVLMLGVAVFGQMAGSMTLDHFGLMGLEQRPVSAERLAGVGLLIAGVGLILRSR